MKAKTIFLVSDEKMDEALADLRKCEIGNKYKVVISNAGDKTSKQRGYEHVVYDDILESGLGGERHDTHKAIHTGCKQLFALPIFLRDDEFFRELYEAFAEIHKNDPEHLEWFADRMVHTEKMDCGQMAEYITKMLNYWIPKGAVISDPKDYGLK